VTFKLVRTVVLSGALAVTGVATAAVPAGAAPQTSAATAARQPDPVAFEAGAALVQLQLLGFQRDGRAEWAAYVAARDAVAAKVASRLGVDVVRMQVAWASADLAHQTALLAALTQLGVPYRRNTSQEGVGFDCSGLTTYAWAKAGHTLTRQSGVQIREAAPRTPDTAQAGDLVQYPGHVMMWLGVDTTIVHAPYTGRTVEVDHATTRRSLKFGDPTG